MTAHKIFTGLACLCIGACSLSIYANTIDEQGKLLDQMERSISHVERKDSIRIVGSIVVSSLPLVDGIQCVALPVIEI